MSCSALPPLEALQSIGNPTFNGNPTLTPTRIPTMSLRLEKSPRLSPKQACFEVAGQQFLIQTGHAAFFMESKKLRHYPEVQASWEGAVRVLDLGTPKLRTNSAAEQGHFELFFVELRHGDPASAFSKNVSLIQDRGEDFWNAVGRVLVTRQIPHNAKPPLSNYLVCGWLHSFFWGLSNEDRVLLLCRVYGVSTNISESTIRRAIKPLGLKDWSDFRQTYLRPPFSVTLFREREHEMFQISLYRPGQS